jgi:hypothetical protein
MCDKKIYLFFIYQSRSLTSLSVRNSNWWQTFIYAKIYEKKLLEKSNVFLKNKILFITFKNNHFVSFVLRILGKIREVQTLLIQFAFERENTFFLKVVCKMFKNL